MWVEIIDLLPLRYSKWNFLFSYPHRLKYYLNTPSSIGTLSINRKCKSNQQKSKRKMSYPFLHEPIRSKETKCGSGNGFKYAVTSCQGWRNTQEDSHVIIPDFAEQTALFAVFDGHNGAEVATYAALHLPDLIRGNANYRNGDIVDGLREAFLALDSAIKRDKAELQIIRDSANPISASTSPASATSDIPIIVSIQSNSDPISISSSSSPQKPPSPVSSNHFFGLSPPAVKPGFNSGCTAVVCLVRRDAFYCANIGDSRCVLSRDDTAGCIPLSFDHTPDIASEHKRIVSAGGAVTCGRINSVINVSRAFGDHCFKNNQHRPAAEQMIIAVPDVIVQPRAPNFDNFLVLMCDGIWNGLDDSQSVIDFVRSRIDTIPLAVIVEQIVDHILPAELRIETGVKGKDNMTIMVIKFDRSSAAASASTGSTEESKSK